MIHGGNIGATARYSKKLEWLPASRNLKNRMTSSIVAALLNKTLGWLVKDLGRDQLSGESSPRRSASWIMRLRFGREERLPMTWRSRTSVSSHRPVGLFGGDIVLENLELRADALKFLDIPVEIKAGFLGRLRLSASACLRRDQSAGCELKPGRLLTTDGGHATATSRASPPSHARAPQLPASSDPVEEAHERPVHYRD